MHISGHLRVLDSKEDVLHAIEAISQLFQGHQHQKNTIFCPKMAKKYQFLAQISVFWVWVVIWCPSWPNLRVLDSKKHVLHAVEAI